MKFIGLLVIFMAIFFPLQAQIEKIDTLKINQLIDSLDKSTVSEETIAFAKKIDSLANQINYQEGRVNAKNWLGNIYSFSGQYEQAVNTLQDAIAIGASINDLNLLGESYLFLAGTYRGLRDIEKAIIYSEEGIALYQKAGNVLKVSFGHITLGTYHLELGEPAKALAYLSVACDTVKKYSTTKHINLCNTNLAIAYVESNRPKEAIPYFEESLRYYKLTKDTFNFAAGYGNLAYCYQAFQAFDQAFIYFDSSLYYSNLLERDEVTYITLADMSKGYELKGDLKNSLKYYKEYHQLYEKVLNEKTKNSIAELEVKFETEKKELALKESQKEVLALEQQAQIRRQRMALIIGGLVMSLLLALFIFYKWRNDIKNKEVKAQLIRSKLENKQLEATFFQNQLENKKADLTNLALDISRKNKFSDQLIEQLEKLQKEKPEKVKTQLRDIIQFAISHLQINEDLAILQKNVDQINQEFYQKMETKFGKLSSNEKYLSGLLRLNLSNKDIATIKGISVSSAKMSRYRLRKKLGLEVEEDIRAFLQGI